MRKEQVWPPEILVHILHDDGGLDNDVVTVLEDGDLAAGIHGQEPGRELLSTEQVHRFLYKRR